VAPSVLSVASGSTSVNGSLDTGQGWGRVVVLDRGRDGNAPDVTEYEGFRIGHFRIGQWTAAATARSAETPTA